MGYYLNQESDNQYLRTSKEINLYLPLQVVPIDRTVPLRLALRFRSVQRTVAMSMSDNTHCSLSSSSSTTKILPHGKEAIHQLLYQKRRGSLYEYMFLYY